MVAANSLSDAYGEIKDAVFATLTLIVRNTGAEEAIETTGKLVDLAETPDKVKMSILNTIWHIVGDFFIEHPMFSLAIAIIFGCVMFFIFKRGVETPWLPI